MEKFAIAKISIAFSLFIGSFIIFISTIVGVQIPTIIRQPAYVFDYLFPDASSANMCFGFGFIILSWITGFIIMESVGEVKKE